MTATPQDVQTKLAGALSHLAATTSSYPQMKTKYGSDWHKWPKTSNWWIALTDIENASVEAGQLVTPKITAAFTYKEVV